MEKNIKIELNDEEVESLRNFATSGHQAYPVLKKIFKHYLDKLESVRTIDSKGNMGLQALAQQKALETVEGMAESIFREVQPRIPRGQKLDSEGKPISQYR